MKKITLAVATIILLVCCKKYYPPVHPKDNDVDTSGTYYVRFTLNDSAYNLTTSTIEGHDLSIYLLGYMQSQHISSDYNVSFGIEWHGYYEPRDSDVMALQGKTIFFQDSLTIQPHITYFPGSKNIGWSSGHFNDSTNYMHINTVTLIGRDTFSGNRENVYVLTGTFNANMTSNKNTVAPLTNGTFNTRLTCFDR